MWEMLSLVLPHDEIADENPHTLVVPVVGRVFLATQYLGPIDHWGPTIKNTGR
jgi:hypothetical protein